MCRSCSVPVDSGVKYCPNCGAYQGPAMQSDASYKKKIIAMGIFYFVQVIICLILRFTDAFDFYPDKIYFEIPIFIMTLGFFFYNYRNLAPLLFFRRVSLKIALLVIPLSVVASFTVSFLVDLLNKAVFGNTYTYVYSFSFLDHKYLWMILLSAAVPAFEEELAYRGILYNQLKDFLRPGQIIWVTSILFTTIHFSVFGAFWIIGFAWVAGWLRTKYQTLWYGIIIHFFFNATAVTIDYLQNE